MAPWPQVLVVFVVALSVTACTQVYTERSSDVPPELYGIADPNDMMPGVSWADGDTDEWLLLTCGSSSCPWEPKEIRKIDDATYEIRPEKTGGWPFCTADLTPMVYRLPAPVTQGTPVTVHLGSRTVEL
ncbi:hypothetical protein [Diaminobutyricimonas sp. LJ205]|uniref:hypothetical protein n=1 Tax=Diaminobutyricimonas sp. LJ205 TaxID=2683590 RepID=UPI0012F52AFE|nr:hypothetical protein [Diaminobutyricimonas sp. LJ205]